MIFKNIFKKRLHIFYRHVHIPVTNLKKRPIWFSYEVSFSNLVKTLREQKSDFEINLTVMFDGNQESYQKDFVSQYAKTFNPKKEGFNFGVHLIQAGSDASSFYQTLDYIKNQKIKDADLIYVLENDYLHIKNWPHALQELVSSNIDFDYLSLYDHKDKYFLPMYENLESKIYFSGHHWRTTPSTCGTFLTRFSTLIDDLEVIKKSGGDFYFFKALREQKQRVLITPIPGLSTHCMNDYLSPGIDWASIAKFNFYEKLQQ